VLNQSAGTPTFGWTDILLGTFNFEIQGGSLADGMSAALNAAAPMPAVFSLDGGNLRKMVAGDAVLIGQPVTITVASLDRGNAGRQVADATTPAPASPVAASVQAAGDGAAGVQPSGCEGTLKRTLQQGSTLTRTLPEDAAVLPQAVVLIPAGDDHAGNASRARLGGGAPSGTEETLLVLASLGDHATVGPDGQPLSALSADPLVGLDVGVRLPGTGVLAS
jgi:hypothetical protein